MTPGIVFSPGVAVLLAALMESPIESREMYPGTERDLQSPQVQKACYLQPIPSRISAFIRLSDRCPNNGTVSRPSRVSHLNCESPVYRSLPPRRMVTPPATGLRNPDCHGSTPECSRSPGGLCFFHPDLSSLILVSVCLRVFGFLRLAWNRPKFWTPLATLQPASG